MKWMILVIAASLAGCISVPIHAFSPYTTSNGQEKWRFVYQNMDEAMVQGYLESEIGRSKICSKGWEELSRTPSGRQVIIDGQCKK